MARPKSYRDLIVWQKEMNLARQAYAVTVGLPKTEAYGLLSQIRRAAVSIPSNIAGGQGRLTDLQLRHFLGNAHGSLYELRTQIELASDLGYFNRDLVSDLMSQSDEVARLLNGLLASLKPIQDGTKFNAANSANTAGKRLHQ